MSFILVIGMAAAISGEFRTYLTGDAIRDFGLVLSGEEFEAIDAVPPFPMYFALDTSGVKDCDVVAVGLRVENESGAEVLGTTISGSANGIYTFRLASSFIESASLAVRCDSGPDAIDRVYIFDVEEAF